MVLLTDHTHVGTFPLQEPQKEDIRYLRGGIPRLSPLPRKSKVGALLAPRYDRELPHCIPRLPYRSRTTKWGTHQHYAMSKQKEEGGGHAPEYGLHEGVLSVRPSAGLRKFVLCVRVTIPSVSFVRFVSLCACVRKQNTNPI